MVMDTVAEQYYGFVEQLVNDGACATSSSAPSSGSST